MVVTRTLLAATSHQHAHLERGNEAGAIGSRGKPHGGEAGAFATDIEVRLCGIRRTGASMAAGKVDGKADAAAYRQLQEQLTCHGLVGLEGGDVGGWVCSIRGLPAVAAPEPNRQAPVLR